MNISDTLSKVLLVVGSIMLINAAYTWWKGTPDDAAFIAPTSLQDQRPLHREVDFIDKEKETPEQLIQVETPFARMNFTNRGASLSDLTCIRTSNNKKQTFDVWSSEDIADREMNAFLVALDERSPYFYTLKYHQDTDEQAVLMYHTETEQAIIEKEFEVSKTQHTINLTLTVKPKKPVHVRLLWPSPSLKELGEDDVVSSAIINRSNSFSQQPLSSMDLQQGFLNPTLFGTSDKYFIFTMVKDTNGFAERAYFKSINKHVISFLESKKIEEPVTWKLSFYFGPKEVTAMRPVDVRLEKSLNYGIFSFLTRPLIQLLTYIDGYTHNYGWAIIIVTFLIKLLLFPFTFKSESKMREFQESQRKLEYLNNKFKDNAEALQQARLEHMQKNGVSGLLGGCLPMLLPMPIFFALSSALGNSLSLYKEPFIWWIQDLSKPDPYYILSIITVIAIVMSGLGASGKKGTAAIVMPIVMALMFGAFTASAAAGLSLYLCLNMVLHVGQIKIQKMLGL